MSPDHARQVFKLERVPQIELNLRPPRLLLLWRDIHRADALLVLLLAPVKNVVNLLEESQQFLSFGVEVSVDDDSGIRVPGPVSSLRGQRGIERRGSYQNAFSPKATVMALPMSKSIDR